MTHPLAWLDAEAAARRAAGLRHELRPRGPHAGSGTIDLAGHDYLGLSTDPRVVAGGIEALRVWGAGSTGSRLGSGSTTLHTELERELAAFCGFGDALVFSSGYTANLGAVTALSGPGALVVSDAGAHASLVDACRLSRARVQVVPHHDTAAVAAALAGRDEERALVVTDSVGSADGEPAPLRELHRVCREHGAVLLADEANGVGVRGPGGRGLLAEYGLAGADDVLATVTLSTGLGSQGGAVLAPPGVTAHLVDAARSFIFDTGLNPAATGAALAALRVLVSEQWRAGEVLRTAAVLAAAAGVGAPSSAVVPVLLGEPGIAVAAATRCLESGLRVGCLRPPSVPAGTSRLRLTARADLSPDELERACTVLAEVLAQAPVDVPAQLPGRQAASPTGQGR